ncbi:VOC family protein [Chloroflexota bacterium]
MKIEKLDHVHINVEDIEKAVKFFEDTLGVKAEFIRTMEENGIKEALIPPGLILLQGLTPDSWVAKDVRKRGEGLSGVSLKVSNIDEGIAELQSKGMRLIGRYKYGEVQEALFHPKDSHGVLIELGEYPGDDPVASSSM